MARDAGYISRMKVYLAQFALAVSIHLHITPGFVKTMQNLCVTWKRLLMRKKLLVLPLNVRSSLTDRSPVQEPRQMEKSQIKSL